MFGFERLGVWKKSVDLRYILTICEQLLMLSDCLGRSDRYSLGGQLKRAAISVSNPPKVDRRRRSE